MNFDLKPNNRNSSDKDLINDLISVAKKLDKTVITRNEYDKHGRYSEGTLRKRFGGWLSILEKAGLSATKNYNVTEEQLIKELQRIASLPYVKVLSKGIFNKYNLLSNTTKIERHFGSWSEALRRAGLHIAPSQSRYSDEDLFENLLAVWTHHRRQPTVTEMGEPPSIITPNTYSNRFGNWRKALGTFVARMNQDEREIEHVIKKEKTNNARPTINKPIGVPEIVTGDRRGIGLGLRYKVLSKDNFKCMRCGESPATDQTCRLHVDHIVPFSKGGKTSLENLQTLCEKCNLGKGNAFNE